MTTWTQYIYHYMQALNSNNNRNAYFVMRFWQYDNITQPLQSTFWILADCCIVFSICQALEE